MTVYMRSTLVIIVLLILQFPLIAQPFQFPETRMGVFAKTWFDYVNEGDLSIQDYDQSAEWADYLESMRMIAKSNKGIIPLMLSYETENEISIYSKEMNGGFVRVILALSSSNELSELSIRKGFIPNVSDNYLSISEFQIEEIIRNIAASLKTEYVRKNLGLEYANAILSNLDGNKYSGIKQADLLAKVLTSDLIKISGDKHLEIIPPTQLSAVQDRFGYPELIKFERLDVTPFIDSFKFIESDPDNKYSITVMEISDDLSLMEEETSNRFITGKIIENNIGKITLERFVGEAEGLTHIEEAFQSIITADYIVIDLRYSGGGDGDAAEAILGYLLTTDHKFSTTFSNKEVFVLTSERTISAGESVAYQLKEAKRALIIGERTAGAGYRVDVFDVGQNFFFVNSTSTSFDETKGEGWQGIGVKPDVKVDPEIALEYVFNKIRTE